MRAHPAARRSPLVLLAAVSLLLAGLVVTTVADPPDADARVATGGAGRFVGSIDWFEWGTPNELIPNSGITKTNTVSLGGQTMQITCSLSGISQTGGTGTALKAYRPGSWQGDALDDMYNIGGTAGSNQLVSGLANNVAGATDRFHVACSATIGGAPFPLAGLVMADAEQSGPAEYVAATPTPATAATWRIIDRYRTPGCTASTQATRTIANQLRLTGPVTLCGTGPAVVGFMDGATAADVEIHGGGASAIALGVMVSVDHGDAPASYGDAAHVVQYDWAGGTVPVGTTQASNTTFALASPAQPPTRLGSSVDPEQAAVPGSTALGDDGDGTGQMGPADDEDAAIPPATIVVKPGDVYTQSGIACTGPGTVAGWIDWNHDGDFADAGERSNNASCTAGSVNLSWTVPSGVTPAVGANRTFMRLRIASNATQIANASGFAFDGEAEDYAVNVTLPPRLTLTKQVASRIDPADQFTVTMAGQGLPQGGVSASTTGSDSAAGTGQQFVTVGGDYTLTDAMATGSPSPLSDYGTTVSCVDAAKANMPVATTGSGPAWTVSGLANGQDVRCTITNTARPPVLDVAKVAVGSPTGPAADGSYSARYDVTVTNSGPTAGTYGALTDNPSFATNLAVDGESWTTDAPGVPPASMAGSGPFRLAPAGTPIAPRTTHTYHVTVTFHFSNTSPASACNGSVESGLFNRVSVPAGQESDSSNNTSCQQPPSPPGPRLALDKTAGSVTDLDGNGPDAGDTVTYTFEVANPGDVMLDQVTVSDPKVGPVTCPGGPLAPGASRLCSPVTYALTQGDVDAGSVDNTATATGKPPYLPSVSSTDSTSTPVPSNPLITLDKTHGAVRDLDGNGPDAGDTLTYSFAVTNTGNRQLTAIAVSDPKVGPVSCPVSTLAPGASTTCTQAYTLTQADLNAGGVPNTATATGTSPGGSTVQATDTDTVTLSAGPKVSIDKSAGALDDVDGNGPDAGDTIIYSFTVANIGNVTLDPVAVTDPKVGGPVACGSGPLAPEAGRSCSQVTYTLTQADVDAGSVDNTASVAGTPPSGPPVTASDATSTPVASNPKIALTKHAGTPVDVNASGITDAGDTVAYSFTVTNLGNRALDPVTVTDPLVGTVTCPSAPLAPDASVTCAADAPYAVKPSDEGAGSVDNTATASGTAPDGTVVTAVDSTSTAVTTPQPRLTLDKRAAAPVDVNGSGITDAGDTIAFSFTVRNDGNVPVHAVGIDDPTVGAAACAPTVLAPGEVAACTAPAYVVTDGDEAAGSVDNLATATGSDPDGDPVRSDPDATSTPVTTPAPSISIAKHAAPPVDVNDSGITDAGDTVAYTFTVRNEGNVPLTGVAVADTLAGPVVCPAGTLAPNESVECVAAAPYVVKDGDEVSGRVDNSATASGTDPDGDPVTSDPDTTSTPVTAPDPRLTLDKRAARPVDVNGSGITDAGDTIGYTFTVTNAGNVPLTQVAVDDPTAGPVTCSPTSLAPGASATCSVDQSYTVTGADEVATAVVNRATATGTDPDGAGVASNQDTTSTPVTTPAPRLSIDKRAEKPVDVNDSGITDAGDTIAYAFVVKNEGNVPVSGIAVDDPKTGTVTCTPTTLSPGDSAACAADATYVVTAQDETAGLVRNTAVATGVDPDGGTVTSDPDSTNTPAAIPAPVLTLDKRAGVPVDVNGSGITDAGDTIAYTFTLTNDGNVPVSGITVTDPLAGSVTCAPDELAVGDFVVCTADAPYVVNAADEAAGTVLNVATAHGVDPDGGAFDSNDDSTSTPVTTPAPKLTLDKRAGTPIDVNDSGITDAGDTLAYTFTVTNEGNVPVSDIAIVDAKVGPVTCTPTALGPGDFATCTTDTPYVVTEGDEATGSVENSATATGTDPDGGDVTSDPDTTSTPVTTPRPKVTLDKRAADPVDVNGSGLTDAGDTIAYTFLVTNDGNVRVSTIQVVDPTAGPVTCLPTTLAPSEVASCTADSPYVVSQVDESAGSVVNVAHATGRDPDDGAVRSNDDTTATPTTVPDPKLTLDKFAGNPVDVNGSGITDAGDTIAFTFTVRNSGNVPVSALTVSDGLAGAVTCTPTALRPAEVATCSADEAYVVTEGDETAGSVVNHATALATDPDGDQVESNEDTTSTTVTIPDPKITLEKTAQPAVDINGDHLIGAGDTIGYLFTVTNTGNVPVTDIVVADPTAGAVSCAPTTLVPGAVAECATDTPYTVTQADADAGKVVNRAASTGLDPDGGPVASNEDTVTVPTDRKASLLLDKSAAPPVDVDNNGADVGDTIAYTFTVRNTGTVTVSGVAIDDPLAGGVTCDPTTLAPGDVASCTADAPYEITQPQVDAGTADNAATASGTAAGGADVTSNLDATSTPIDLSPSLVLVKRATLNDGDGDGLADVGETVTYTFDLRNAGNVTISDAAVSDPMLAGLRCEQVVLAPHASTACRADPHRVTQSDVDAGTIVNTAVAHGNEPDGEPVESPPSQASTRSDGRAGIALDKRAGEPSDADGNGVASTGDTIDYTFVVTNTGTLTLHGVGVADPKAGAVSCPVSALAPREAATCTAAPYVITQADVDAGSVQNTARASGAPPTGAATTSEPDSTSTPTDPARALFLKKTASLQDQDGDHRADPGEQVRYRFLVRNTGAVTITDISVQDPMLDGVSCPTQVLAGGDQMVCHATYVVTRADMDADELTNTATATGSGVTGKVHSRASTAVLPTEGAGGSGRGEGPLPGTGGPAGWLFPGGLALIAAGLAGILVGRRTREREQA
ncbi:CshA/CshB family fibrillar adhesin-related protein [Nocardioides sp. LHG3406-4]|uniref:CshA/CshB family fibrillar adhesin-related protein n=1 Tax=Nocardioides sp. LHG3406-4 TaxID=2804575 RepID=UPI003CED7AFD